MANENALLARRWFEEVWNQRRTDTIDELLTEESVSHSELGFPHIFRPGLIVLKGLCSMTFSRTVSPDTGARCDHGNC
jgi:hypothetical protein